MFLQELSHILAATGMDIRFSGIEFNGEKPLELEIEEFLACLSTDPICSPKTNHLEEDNLRSMEKEHMLYDLKKEDKEEYHDPIEIWFQLVVRSH
jgi:hypothetical protein